MKGVTIATFRRYIDPKATKDDLRHITDAQLADVYKRQYWDAVGGDLLPDGVDYAVFDFAVNSGPGRAARYLQSVLGAPMDGAIGSATLDAVAKMPVGVVIDRLCDARLAFLKSLGTWGTFGKGWAARVAAVRRDALLMTAQPAAPVPAPVPAPSAPIPVPVSAKPAPDLSGLAGFLALAAMAVAGFWQHLTAWFHSLF
jgi:lysozyme family protein